MDRLKQKVQNSALRQNRVRTAVKGSSDRPRLSVNVSNQHVIAQIIDDSTHKTIVYVTSVGQKGLTGSLTDKAAWAGTEIAKKAKAAKLKQVVFDRGARLYHGRVKALADAARKEGLEF